MVQKGRYEVVYGKFGAYFYDDKTKKDLTLDDVLWLLNKEPYDDVISTVTVTKTETVRERVIQVVGDILGKDHRMIEDQTMLVENLGADSLGLLELEVSIDNEFDIMLEPLGVNSHRFTTVYALICDVNDKLGSK